MLLQTRPTYTEDCDFRKVGKSSPFFTYVLSLADDDDLLQLVVVKVAGAKRHNQVAKTNQRRVGVGKQTHDHVIGHHRHRSLLTCLQHHNVNNYRRWDAC